MFTSFVLFLTLLLYPKFITSIVLDVDNYQSIRNAAGVLAYEVQSLYNGNQSGGVLGKWPYPPYYWWESGGAWGGMMQYWAFSHDETYNEVMMNALVSQLGPFYDFVRAEEAFDEGNDDQAFWVFNAMSAAEYGFPNPPAPAPSWLKVVENAWMDFYSRWNYTNCHGGLKWQFHQENLGFYYKNSISNGAFFQISARLYRFTGNETYYVWANEIWDWVTGVGLIDDIYNVFDGTDELLNCSEIDHTQWTYNVGVFLYGSAALSNFTNASEIWVDRTNGLLAATDTFFTPFTNATNIMFEARCELVSTCNTDQQAMKAFLARWLAGTSQLAPYTTDEITTRLRASALGGASACTGPPNGNTCGSKWYIDGYDGITGLGQQLAALDVVTGLLISNATIPKTAPNITISVYVPPPPSERSDPSSTSTARPLYDSPNNGFAIKNSIPTIGALLPLVAYFAA